MINNLNTYSNEEMRPSISLPFLFHFNNERNNRRNMVEENKRLR